MYKVKTPLAEQETTQRYDPIADKWIAWSNIKKHIDRMKRNGWTLTKEDKYGAFFEAPGHALTIGKAEKRKRREMTEEEKQACRLRLHPLNKD